MEFPNVWGQGALFVFSGLEGTTSYAHQMIGGLLGDDPGIRFHTHHSCDLFLDCTGLSDLSWEMVSSDLITGVMKLNDRAFHISFVFAEAGVIVGRCPKGRLRLRFGCGKAYAENAVIDFPDEQYRLQIQTDGDADYFAFSMNTDFTFLPADVLTYEQQRRSFYEQLPPVSFKDDGIERTFFKAVSVMKSQVYAPEGQFKQHWTTPDRFPHRALWLWDSIFHSFGNQYISVELARDSILSVLDTQREDGFIAHMATPNSRSEVTQPPVIAWGVQKLYQKTNDRDFLRECYPKLEQYLLWNMQHRMTPDGLFYWHIDRSSVHCRCDESGMDNSPRFDGVAEMDCIDFSCYMLHEAEMMVQICAELQNGQESFWADVYAKLKKRISTLLWDDSDGLFYDRRPDTGELQKVKSVASFLPLFAGACTSSQAESLVQQLQNDQTFGTPFGIPSIAVDDPTYGTDMWRGPVWINFNYMIAEGLKRYDYRKEADELIRSTVNEIARWYLTDGVFFEFYDDTMQRAPNTLFRKGPPVVPYCPAIRYQAIRDYGWTATLFAAMVLENQSLF